MPVIIFAKVADAQYFKKIKSNLALMFMENSGSIYINYRER
jgi:hypothetical protein